MLRSWSRRGALGFVAGQVAVAGIRHTEAAQPGYLDLTKPDDFHTAIVKVRGSLGPDMLMGYVAGRYYGFSEGRLVPLYGLLAGTFTRHRRLPNGDVEGVSFELAYFTDWDSGELLDAWKNPLTGKTVKVPRFRSEPGRFSITRDARVIYAGLQPTERNRDRFLKPLVVGDDVWITEENASEFASQDGKNPFIYSEIVTFHAVKADIDNPRLVSAPTTVGFQSEVSWRPWQEMGSVSGHLVGNAAGRKLSRIEQFPLRYLDWGRKYHPDVFADVGKFLERGWS